MLPQLLPLRRLTLKYKPLIPINRRPSSSGSPTPFDSEAKPENDNETEQSETSNAKRPHPAVVRVAEKAAKATRTEEFHRYMQEGEGAMRAHQRAEGIYKESLERYTKMGTEQTEEQKNELSEDEKLLVELTERFRQRIDQTIKKEFADNYSEDAVELHKDYLERRRQHILIRDLEDQNRPFIYEKVFTAPSADAGSLIKEEIEQLEERRLKFWREWDDRRTQILGQILGPKNLFEEQIVWTKKGMMWPYPIDNEYLPGQEQENTSFVDHVFLEKEWAKHEVPHSKAVAHFVELILVGLSKNPYMSVEKKREHLRWYADYFKDVMVGKYKELL